MAAPALPGTRVTERDETREGFLPPYNVVLHNDDHNSMDHVVRSLLRCIPELTRERAGELMFEAHNRGSAVVTTVHKELAELYRNRLESCSLTATIEPA